MDDWIVAGRYRVESLIGIGGTAHVYKAVRMDTQEIVAIKMLRPELSQDESFITQFRKESEIAISYHHKNIVETLEIGEEDGGLYIVMEYIEGSTLKDIIRAQGPLGHQRAVDYAVQIAEALSYAHAHQLVHRDIKPQNMLIDSRGVLKVSDFGIARSASVSTATISGGSVMGSVHYISPEQAQGNYVDTRSDLYSLGVVLYEMATGKVPFEGDTAVSVAIKHIRDRIVPPSRIWNSVPHSLESVILKAMQKRPQQRYQYAEEMINDLVHTLEDPDGDFVRLGDGTQRMAEALPTVNAGQDKPLVYIGTGRRENGLRRKSPYRVWIMGTALVLLTMCLLVFLGYSLSLLWNQAQSSHNETIPPSSMVMDDFGLVPQEDAVNALRAQGIEPVIKLIFSEEVPEGIVISQSPKADVLWENGTDVVLVVSRGVELLPVPDVLHRSLNEARQCIQDAGLQVGAVKVLQSQEEDNSVLRQFPLPDESPTAARNSLVDLWIARDDSQKAQTMPLVVGMESDAAVSYLESFGLHVTLAEEPSSLYAIGLVCKQIPEPDDPIDDGTAIVLTVSSGILQQWTYLYDASLEIAENGSHVVIWFDEYGPDAAKVYDEVLNKGKYGPIRLSAVSTDGGGKDITIHINGRLEKRESMQPVEGDEP